MEVFKSPQISHLNLNYLSRITPLLKGLASAGFISRIHPGSEKAKNILKIRFCPTPSTLPASWGRTSRNSVGTSPLVEETLSLAFVLQYNVMCQNSASNVIFNKPVITNVVVGITLWWWLGYSANEALLWRIKCTTLLVLLLGIAD